MTKCGHVYCYPCILRYLSAQESPAVNGPIPIPGALAGTSVNSSDALAGPSSRQWKRCPICWDAVYARDLKAVKRWDAKSVASDRDIVSSDSSQSQGHLDQDSQSQAVSCAPSDWLRMRLMERPQITTLALPQSTTWPKSSTSLSDQPLIAQHQAPWHFQPDVSTFAKFMLATPELLLSSLAQDLDELAAERNLLASLCVATGDSSLDYVNLAERKVREQMGKVVTELDTPAVQSAIDHARNDLKEHYEAEQGKKLRKSENIGRRRRRQIEEEYAAHAASQSRSADIESSLQSDEIVPSLPPDVDKPIDLTEGAEHFLALRGTSQGGAHEGHVHIPKGVDTLQSKEETSDTTFSAKNTHRFRRNLNPSSPSSSSYLFYQASSGQNIFMHPLDIKIMHSQFGSYAKFPRDIAVKAQGAEEGSMNEELRKRCKYLAHLPKSTNVVFIEIDWEFMTSTNGRLGNQDHHTIASVSTPLVTKATLKQYDEILRARKNKRRDRERREDRAKLKAEEVEAASRPEGAAAAALRSQKQQQSFPSVEDVYGGKSESDCANLLSGGHGDGSHLANSTRSSAFTVLASWGAEREFPNHPGGSQPEDKFPPVSGHTHMKTFPAVQPTKATAGVSAQKTVWGTPAAESSFSLALHASSRTTSQQHDWDGDVDEAWLELEEGFVPSTKPSRQVRRGRGLNTQSRAQPYAASSNEKAARDVARMSQQSAESNEGPDVVVQGSGNLASKGKKQHKAKLILTGGGRGTA